MDRSWLISLGVAALLAGGLVAGIHQTWGAPVQVSFFDSSPPVDLSPKAEARAGIEEAVEEDPILRTKLDAYEVDQRTRGAIKKAGLMAGGALLLALTGERILSLFLGTDRAVSIASRTPGLGALAGGSTSSLQPVSGLPGGGSPADLLYNLSDGSIGWWDAIRGIWASTKKNPAYIVVASWTSTTTPGGYKNGTADYGPETIGTTTNGLLEGATAAIASGLPLYVVGTFTQTASTTISSITTGLTVYFRNAYVTDAGTANGIIFAQSVSLLHIECRSSIFTGNGSTTQAAFKITNCAEIVMDLGCTFNSYTKTTTAFIFLLGSTSGVVRGDWRSADSLAFLSQATGDLDVSGFRSVQGGYTSAPVIPQVISIKSPSNANAGRISVHDIDMDWGSQTGSGGGAPVSIAAAAGFTFDEVTVNHVKCSNMGTGSLLTQAYQDGLDVLGAVKCSVDDLVVDGGSDAAAIMNCTEASVRGVIARNCRYSCVQIGDPSDQTGSTSIATVSACVADTVAQSTVVITGAFSVITANGGSIATSIFTGNVVINTTATPYGLYVSNSGGSSGTIGTVVWIGGNLAGFTAPADSHAGAGTIGAVYVLSALGMTPQANISQSLVTPPASTTNQVGASYASSTSQVICGIAASNKGVPFTPNSSGWVLVFGKIAMQTATAAAGVTSQIWYTTNPNGSQNGATTNYTAIGSLSQAKPPGSSANVVLPLIGVVQLTPGTKYYFDVGQATASTSDAVSSSNIDLYVVELF